MVESSSWQSLGSITVKPDTVSVLVIFEHFSLSVLKLKVGYLGLNSLNCGQNNNAVGSRSALFVFSLFGRRISTLLYCIYCYRFNIFSENEFGLRKLIRIL